MFRDKIVFGLTENVAREKFSLFFACASFIFHLKGITIHQIMKVCFSRSSITLQLFPHSFQ